MHSPRWALFFDSHTMPANPDVGKDFVIEGNYATVTVPRVRGRAVVVFED